MCAFSDIQLYRDFSNVFCKTADNTTEKQQQQYSASELCTIITQCMHQKNVLKSMAHMICFGALVNHYKSGKCSNSTRGRKRKDAPKLCSFCTSIYNAFTNTTVT